MGKKSNFLFPLKSSSHLQTTTSHSSWPWPSACTTPKTLSFRAEVDDAVFKTINNSAYFESCFNGGSSVFEESFTTAPETILLEEEEEDSIETMIQGIRSSSERLFFEPKNKTIICSSNSSSVSFKESRANAIVVDSMDPFGDFKKSMEEMIEAHDLKDWECLQELLTCYLNVNNKSNHSYIIGAFVDLLVSLASSSSSSSSPSSIPPPHHHDLLLHNCSSTTNTITTTHSFTSPLSFSSSTFSNTNSPCLSSTLDLDDEKSSSLC